MLDFLFDRPLLPPATNSTLPLLQPLQSSDLFEPLVQTSQMLPTHAETLVARDGIRSMLSSEAMATAVRTAVVSDNTLATAQKLGGIVGTHNFLDAVNSSDANDFYQFTLNSTSTYHFSLGGLSADADLDLLDLNGRVLYSSNNGDNTPEVLSGSLAAGTYYLQVYSYGSAQTNYNLQLMAQAVAIDLAGNTLAGAKNLGTITGTQTFQDFVGSTDINDYYRFTLAKDSNFSLSLSGLQSDADVELLDSRGQQIAYSNGAGNIGESLKQLLSAGTYYVRIFSYASADTRYSLRLAATVSAAIDAGNTLATARNIGLLNGDSVSQTLRERSFQDNLNSTDLNDYYRFSLNRYSALYFTVNGLVANVDVQLLNNAGEILTASTAAGNTMERGRLALASGIYYIRVLSVNRQNTSYALRIVANSLAPDSAGNNLAAARNLGILGSNRTWQDFVGSRDPEDYYRFVLPRTSNFSLSLFGLGADADLQLLNASGQVITSSTNGSNLSESITRVLAAGIYYVQVSRYSGDTLYDLRLGAVSTSSGFSNIHGYGLVNGALAIDRSLGRLATTSNFSSIHSSRWNQEMINAPAAWQQGYTGRGIIVAVIDSGVDYRHGDLDGNIWMNTREIAGNGIDDDRNGYIDDVRGWDFVQNDNDPIDIFGHGTHLAGTIAAENNGVGITGVAYGARIMPVRVLGANGRGSYANIARGVRYAVDNGARVINLSLGGGGGSALLDGAIAYAAQKGAVVVMAAGNEGADVPNYPGRLANRYGVVVGGVTQERREYWLGNRSGTDGSLRYVVAPATNILATTVGGDYRLMSGTSMAAAHVSGLVALMLGANPRLTVEAIPTILTNTATQLV